MPTTTPTKTTAPPDRQPYALSTAGGELAQSVTWSNPAQASPIDTTEPTDQTVDPGDGRRAVDRGADRLE